MKSTYLKLVFVIFATTLVTSSGLPSASAASVDDIAKSKWKSGTGETYTIFKITDKGKLYNMVVYHYGPIQNGDITGVVVIDSSGKITKGPNDAYELVAFIIEGHYKSNEISQKIQYHDSLANTFNDNAKLIRDSQYSFLSVHAAVTGLQVASQAVEGPVIVELVLFLCSGGEGDIGELLLQVDMLKISAELKNIEKRWKTAAGDEQRIVAGWSKITETGGDTQAIKTIRFNSKDMREVPKEVNGVIDGIIKINKIGSAIVKSTSCNQVEINNDVSKLQSAKQEFNKILSTKSQFDSNVDALKGKMLSLRR